MHYDESLADLLNSFKDLEFSAIDDIKRFKCKKNDWENVPVIIPEFLYHLTSQIQAIKQFTLQSMDGISQMNDAVNKINKQFDINDQRREKIEDRITVHKLEMQENIDKNKYEFDSHLEKINIANHEVESHTNPRYTSIEYENEKYSEETKDFFSSLTVKEPKIFSLEQIRKIIYIFLQKSQLNSRLEFLEKNYSRTVEEIEACKHMSAKFIKGASEEFDKISNTFSKNEETVKENMESIILKINELFNNSNLHSTVFREHKKILEEHKIQIEYFNGKLQRIEDRYNKIIKDNVMNIKQMKEEYGPRLTQIEVELKTLLNDKNIDIINSKIDENKEIAKADTLQSIAELEKRGISEYSTLTSKISENKKDVLAKIDNLNNFSQEGFGKYETKIGKAKKYTQNLEYQLKSLSQNLIPHQQKHEAKLFSMNARLLEEETLRNKDFQYIKILFQKLIYSLEKLQRGKIKVMGGHEILPKLASKIKVVEANEEEGKKVGNNYEEILFMKRLLTIKGELSVGEGLQSRSVSEDVKYNPKNTTRSEGISPRGFKAPRSPPDIRLLKLKNFGKLGKTSASFNVGQQTFNSPLPMKSLRARTIPINIPTD